MIKKNAIVLSVLLLTISGYTNLFSVDYIVRIKPNNKNNQIQNQFNLTNV